MPSPLPYFPFYHRDYLSSSLVAQMPLVAEAIYLKLLMFQWEDGFIPGEESRLQRMVRASDSEWAEFLPFVDQAFPVIDSNRRANPRMVKDREKAEQKVETNRAAGSKGGSSRPSNPEPPSDPKPNANPTQTQKEANAKRTINERETNAKPLPDTDTDTEEITSPEKGSGEKQAPSGAATWHHWAEIELPESLAHPEGREAWRKFCRMRSEIKKPIKSKTGADQLLAQLAQFDDRVAVAALLASVKNEWQGVFPGKVPRVEHGTSTRGMSPEQIFAAVQRARAS